MRNERRITEKAERERRRLARLWRHRLAQYEELEKRITRLEKLLKT